MIGAFWLAISSLGVGFFLGLWLGFKLWREAYVKIQPMERSRRGRGIFS